MLEIVAKTNLRAKGQAFIVFDSVEAATRAIEEVNGFDLFDKPMVLDYAKTRSDATVLRENGTDELEAHKRRRMAEKGMLQCFLDDHIAYWKYIFLIADHIIICYRAETSP